MIQTGHGRCATFESVGCACHAPQPRQVQPPRQSARPSRAIVAAPSMICAARRRTKSDGFGGIAGFRRGQDRGKPRGLRRSARPRSCRNNARGGVHPEHARVEFGNVQIDLYNAGLGPGGFDHQGDPGFERLARPVAAMPQEHVLTVCWLMVDAPRVAPCSITCRMADMSNPQWRQKLASSAATAERAMTGAIRSSGTQCARSRQAAVFLPHEQARRAGHNAIEQHPGQQQQNQQAPCRPQHPAPHPAQGVCNAHERPVRRAGAVGGFFGVVSCGAWRV